MAKQVRVKKEKAVVRKVKPCELCGVIIPARGTKRFCCACSDIAKNIYLRESRLKARQSMV